MRADLERAMATAITSRSHSGALVADPLTFAESFGLGRDETEALVTMSNDLAALMPGFVSKRQQGLSWAGKRTLAILGEHASGLLDEFTDTHPGVEALPDDQMAFLEFLVRAAERLEPLVEHGAIAVEMARFEKMETRARAMAAGSPTTYLAELGATGAAPHLNGSSPGRADAGSDSRVQLAPSARLGRFTWDLRQLRSYQASLVESMQPDPCALLVFHTCHEHGLRVLRLRPDIADLVERVAGAPDGLEPADLVGDPGEPGHEMRESEISRLLSAGALRRTGPS